MRTILWMLGGFVLGGGLAFGLGILLPEIITISQFEGAYMMGVGFVWTPLGAVLGAITGLVMRLTR